MQNQRTPSRLAGQLLIAVTTVAMIGCQAAAHRRHSARVLSSSSLSTQAVAPRYAYESAETPSASSRPQFSADAETAESSPAAVEATSAVVSAADALEMFSRMRGKLRADDSGAIVEADLSYSDVTDESLASIDLFSEIKELDLTGTQVHDESLVSILRLPKLQSLKLKGTQISSQGMTSLTQITTLVLLDASGTAVADEGLTQASSWTSLRYLSLNNTSVTDAAIPNLISIKTLKGLSLLNTRVTPEGAQTLKESLPDCLIVTKKELESNPSAAIDPLQPVPSQSDATFPNLLTTSDPQLEQLAELAGKQPQLAVHLASVYSDHEQWPQAARILSAAVAADPSLQPVEFALGIALARSGDTAAAMAHLTQAAGEAEASYHIGQIEYENNLRACADHFRQALAADPSLTIAQTRLKEVQRELAGLNQRRPPVHAATYRSAQTVDTPMEIIPATPVRSVGLSRPLPR